MSAIALSTGTFGSIAYEGEKINTTAGAALGQFDACYIDSNGQAQKAVSTHWLVTGTGGQIAFDGFCVQDVASGEAVTLYGRGSQLDISAGNLTPDTALWASATAGILSDVPIAAAGTDQPVAKAISTKRIKVLR